MHAEQQPWSPLASLDLCANNHRINKEVCTEAIYGELHKSGKHRLISYLIRYKGRNIKKKDN